MNWFILALIPPALWAVSNHIDKYLVDKYLKGVSIAVLVVFSGIGTLLTALAIYSIKHNVVLIDPVSAFLLLVNGALYMVAFMPYYAALREEDASSLVPIFQTIPVFNYFLGYFVLGETLTLKAIMASVVIVIGALGVSLDLNDKLPRVKFKPLLLMVATSFMLSLNKLIFKYVTIEGDFWKSVFWDSLGLTVFGALILVFSTKYRRQFFQVLKKNRVSILAVNGLNEVTSQIADGVMKYAIVLAPMALVSVVTNGFQPIFVFIYGLLLTLFFPQISQEKINRRDIIQKITSIFIVLLGSYWLAKEGGVL